MSDLERQPVLEQATYTYYKVLIVIGAATLLSLLVTGLSLLTAIGAVLMIIGGVWMAVITWAVWG